MRSRKQDVDALICQHLPLVERAARRICRQVHYMVDFQDVRQIGVVALVEAAHRFEDDRNVPFELWAMRRVRGAMIDGLSSLTGLSRAHVRAISDHNHLKNSSTETQERLQRTMRWFSQPGFNEINNIRMIAAQNSPVIQVIRGDTAEDILNRRVQTETHSDPARYSILRERMSLAQNAMLSMSTEERDILTGHYIEGRSLSDIAAERGVSRSWLSRLHKRALERAQALIEL